MGPWGANLSWAPLTRIPLPCRTYAVLWRSQIMLEAASPNTCEVGWFNYPCCGVGFTSVLLMARAQGHLKRLWLLGWKQMSGSASSPRHTPHTSELQQKIPHWSPLEGLWLLSATPQCIGDGLVRVCALQRGKYRWGRVRCLLLERLFCSEWVPWSRAAPVRSSAGADSAEGWDLSYHKSSISGRNASFLTPAWRMSLKLPTWGAKPKKMRRQLKRQDVHQQGIIIPPDSGR